MRDDVPQFRDGCESILLAEDRTAGDERVCSAGDNQRGGFGRYATIDLDPNCRADQLPISTSST